jgi:hypothetical protein
MQRSLNHLSSISRTRVLPSLVGVTLPLRGGNRGKLGEFKQVSLVSLSYQHAVAGGFRPLRVGASCYEPAYLFRQRFYRSISSRFTVISIELSALGYEWQPEMRPAEDGTLIPIAGEIARANGQTLAVDHGVRAAALDHQAKRRGCVPVRRRELIGVVVGLDAEPPAAPARDVLAVPDPEAAVPRPLLATAEWIAGYYGAPLGLTLKSMLPAGMWGESQMGVQKSTIVGSPRPVNELPDAVRGRVAAQLPRPRGPDGPVPGLIVYSGTAVHAGRASRKPAAR